MKNHYAVWLKDADGNENHFTGLLEPSEAVALDAKLTALQGTGAVTEFVVVRETSLAYDTLLPEIAEWLGVSV
jgi:hypothetical protein